MEWKIGDEMPKEIACWGMGPDFTFQWHTNFYPNWFQRIMYRVLLGIYWKKL